MPRARKIQLLWRVCSRCASEKVGFVKGPLEIVHVPEVFDAVGFGSSEVTGFDERIDAPGIRRRDGSSRS